MSSHILKLPQAIKSTLGKIKDGFNAIIEPEDPEARKIAQDGIIRGLNDDSTAAGPRMRDL